jgi:hypothetical protein
MDILQRIDMAECHSTLTPADAHAKRGLSSLRLTDLTIGVLWVLLQYLTLTRSNLVYVVQQVCLFMHALCESHLVLVRCILRYLKGTLSFRLRIGVGPIQSLTSYFDEEWVGCPDSRCSTSIFCVYL